MDTDAALVSYCAWGRFCFETIDTLYTRHVVDLLLSVQVPMGARQSVFRLRGKEGQVRLGQYLKRQVGWRTGGIRLQGEFHRTGIWKRLHFLELWGLVM